MNAQPPKSNLINILLIILVLINIIGDFGNVATWYLGNEFPKFEFVRT